MMSPTREAHPAPQLEPGGPAAVAAPELPASPAEDLGCSLALERAARRAQSISKAYAGPDHIHWSMASFYSGVAAPSNAVVPALRTYESSVKAISSSW